MTGYRRDLVVALAGATLGAAAVAVVGGGVLAYVAASVAGAALGLVRRHPRIAWIIATAALLTGAQDAALLDVPFFIFVAHAFGAGRWDGRWSGAVGLAALLGAAELCVAMTDDSPVPYALLTAAVWGAGRALREREEVANQLVQRARELEEERDAHAALSVRYERARIASELHDIVAHAISVMVVQASAGQRLAASDPDRTAATFAAISDAAHQAEEDMARLVALLGDEDAIGPAPDLALVEELVARAAGSGLDVTLRLEGEREGLPAPLVQAAYRVVQEGLTNALRYASGAAVSVALNGRADELLVEVGNGPAAGDATLAGTGTGNGIRGLRELVGGYGGAVDAGPTPEGGWQLSARLPRRIPANLG
jgi:signal transduction histidine kinase